MYPRVCPVCHRESEELDRGFEHVSMFLHGSGKATLYLRCKRCQKVFPWQEDERAESTRPERSRAT
jgi:uncharacterized metal-binding protein YceD (DUF177 family)